VFKYLGRRGATGRKRKLTGLVALALACTLAVGVYAFTASNTVAAHSAGAGVAVVSGYTVSSPTNYIFSGDGLTMVGVTFDLDKAASDVQVALTPGTPLTANWSDCGASSGGEFAVTCTFAAPVPVAEGTHLSVAAVSSGTVTIE
jgi:type 1 fimbria pilin